MAGAHLFGRRVLLDVVVVRALDLLAGDDGLGAHRFLIDRQKTNLPLLGHAIGFLVLVEVLRDVRVGRGRRIAELVGRKGHDRELDLLVAPLVFLRDVVVVDRDPAGERRLELLDGDAAAQLVFELVGAHRRHLHAQDLPVALVADELAVLLEGRERQDALAHFGVARRDPEPRGFGGRGLLLDHLLDDALVDAELLQQLLVDVGAVRLPVGAHLLFVDAPELRDGDLAGRRRRRRPRPFEAPWAVSRMKLGI